MALNYPLLPVNRTASGAIPAYRITCPTTTDGVEVLATAATQNLCGVSGAIAAATTERCEVHRAGIVPLEYGATVQAGQPLTADASGRGIPATAGQNTIGRAQENGGVGAIGSVLISPASVPNAGA